MLRHAQAGPGGEQVQVPKVEIDKVQLAALVEDGGTIAVCGFRRMVEVREERPAFGGSVPAISKLFKNVAVARVPEEFVWLITPRIIVPGAAKGVNLSQLVD